MENGKWKYDNNFNTTRCLQHRKDKKARAAKEGRERDVEFYCSVLTLSGCKSETSVQNNNMIDI